MWVKTVILITWKMYSALKTLNKSNMSMQVLANTIIVVKNSTTYELLIFGSFNTLSLSLLGILFIADGEPSCLPGRCQCLSSVPWEGERQRQIWGIVCPLQILWSPLSSRPQWRSKVPNRFCRVFVLCWSPASVGWLITCSFLLLVDSSQRCLVHFL